jgi:hypothetical protein
MKTFLPILLILAISACTKINPADMAIKKKFCTNMIMQNEYYLNRIAEEVRHNPRGIEVYNTQVKIDSLRRIYLKSTSHENLIIYTDSVSKLFKIIGVYDKMIDEEIVRNKKLLSSSGDSTSVLNLLFWSLTAEMAVHEEAMNLIAISDWFRNSIPCHINKTIFHAGDTVMVSVGSPYTLQHWELRFDEVECVNSKTKNAIKPKIYLTGPVAFLMYQPKEEGDYIIHGPVNISYEDNADFQASLVMDQRFKVEGN